MPKRDYLLILTAEERGGREEKESKGRERKGDERK